MATILVDYENVQSTYGLRGAEYLNDKDRLVLFFSESCLKISAGYMEDIEKSGCAFSGYKLKQPRKNALDFYIATEAGRLSAAGETQIIIVTRDKGFASIAEYFTVNEALNNTRIVLGDNIESGLAKLSDPDNADRRNLINNKRKALSLEAELGRIKEAGRIRDEIEKVLRDTEYADRADNVVRFLTNKENSTAKELYTGSLHEFGIKDGVVIYRLIKQVV
ncbi:MAG: hypothetical protein K5669_03675 [Lachnospiraceae bacterium]|nr:hypothetical protein [Lachnospiraceae bacterium]